MAHPLDLGGKSLTLTPGWGSNVARRLGFLVVVLTVPLAGRGGVAVAGSTGHDDHDSSALAATLLPIGQPLGGTLSDSDDVDAFRVDLAGSARIEVRTSGATDTRGRLLEASGAVIARDDDSGPGGHNFRIVEAVKAGVYYVEVSGAAGDYAVMARLTHALDQSDTAATSMLLTLHEEGSAGVMPNILQGASGRIWPSAADVDVFRLDVPRDGTDVTVRSSGRLALRARLVDSSLADVATDARGGTVRIERRLDAGTYYVVISAADVGTYRLLATADWFGDACAQPLEARDDGSSPESSTLLSVGGPPVAATISEKGDVDVFRLDLAGDALVELRTSGGTDTQGALLDGGGSLIASDEDSGPGTGNFRIVEELSAGIYYVAVTGAPGAGGVYAVSARLGGALDHADVPWTSTRLPLHGAVDLARVKPDILLGTAGRIWPSTADVDVFRLDVARNSTVVRIRTSGGTALHARLMHAGDALVEVAQEDPGGDVHMETLLDAGIYYLTVGGHDTGAYRVLAWGYEAGFAPPDKAAFDALVAGKWLAVSPFHAEPPARYERSFRFVSQRRFDPAGEAYGGGRYTYERGSCPHSAELALDYDDGGRCAMMLSLHSATTGHATFSCDDGSRGIAQIAIIDEEPVRIPDSELADSIRRALGRRCCDGSPITVADMASLRRLSVLSPDDLTGLEMATGLTYLWLETDADSTLDLWPLSRLTGLNRLTLWGGGISDLSPLAGLTNLKELHLQSIRASDLAPLSGLTSLSRLYLADHSVSNLSPLAGLASLEGLDLRGNEISDLAPLAGLTNLTELKLDRNYRISDLSPLSGLTLLRSLTLSGNTISDVSALAHLKSLTELSLRDNGISDLSPLSALTSLTWLDLSGNGISDLSPLAGLTSLPTLHLSDNRISDLSPLSALTSLTRLDLSGNGISDLSPLAGLTSLPRLYLLDNRISDLSPLSALTSLWDLHLSGNGISDLSPLAGLASLQRLHLSDNRISDLSPLSALTSLWWLHLSGNKISDLSPLSDLPSLSSLYLSHNSIWDVWPLSGLASLQRLGLRGNLISDVSPLSSLRKLEYLSLAHNAIVELADLTVAYGLDLAGNQIADLTPLGFLPPNLDVEANAVTAVPSASLLSGTEGLYLGGNEISGIEPLVERARAYGDEGAFLAVSLWRNPAAWESRLRSLGVVLVGDSQLIPLVVNAGARQRLDRRGVVRLVNLPHADGGLNAWLYAPRLGSDARPAAVVFRGRTVVHVDADDIRRGERDKGVYGQLPIGPGDAALEIYSSFDVRASAYVRTADGFLASVHDTVPVDANGRHAVPIFNPASNARQESLLRLINIGGNDANVSILGIDDVGTRRGPVTLVVPAGTATVLGAGALEDGTGTELSGRLGDGEGRWRLDVRSDGEIAVMSLLESPTGHLTNLSTSAADNFVALLPSASHPTLRGWVRVVNRGHATSVDIRGVDDTGTAFGPITVSIAAGHAVDFDSDEWENGNASKGLSNGVGRGRGDWRLQFSSEGDIEVSAYVETEDGFLANIHDRVSRTDCPSWNPGCGTTYHTVAPFHPVGADGVGSSLRMVNDGDDVAFVAIWGFDERGMWSGPVFLELGAGKARTVTAQEMAQGGEGLTGWLRKGTGTWELRMRVTSSGGRVTVVNVLEDASGHMTNLSTLPTRRWAYHRSYDSILPSYF